MFVKNTHQKVAHLALRHVFLKLRDCVKLRVLKCNPLLYMRISSVRPYILIRQVCTTPTEI